MRGPVIFLAALLTASGCVGNVSEPQLQSYPAPSLADAGSIFVPNPGAEAQVPTQGQWVDAGLGWPVVDASSGPGAMVVPTFDAQVMPVGSTDGGLVGLVDAGGFQPDAQAPVGGSRPENPCGSGPEPLVANLRISKIDMYQTVKVPLYKDNAWVSTRNASLVQGKKSYVRVSVEPMSGFSSHAVRGVLTLDNDGEKTVLTDDQSVSKASSDEDEASTFDFKVDGKLVGPNTKLSASVIETSCPAQPSTASAARVPQSGSTALEADKISDMHVVLVPVTLNGITPDTSDDQLKKVTDALRAYYPVADVTVSFREPITWSGYIGADGTGWSSLLNQIGRQRQSDGVAGNVYYFGMMNPAKSFRQYCLTSCVLGLAPQTTFVSRPNQIGLGVGFVDENTYTTVVHELGHAHGLPHAPCVPRGGSIEGADTKFPYSGGKIGDWGWDSRSEKLMSPSTYTDIMGYCEPVWISDYNYEKIATRAKVVNAAQLVFNADKSIHSEWQGILLSASGGAQWSGITLEESPGQTELVHALDATGTVVADVQVVRIPLSHSDDSFLYVEAPDPSWAALDLGDRILNFAQIAPAAP